MILFHSIHEITDGLKALYIFKVYLSSEGTSEHVFHWQSFFSVLVMTTSMKTKQKSLIIFTPPL